MDSAVPSMAIPYGPEARRKVERGIAPKACSIRWLVRRAMTGRESQQAEIGVVGSLWHLLRVSRGEALRRLHQVVGGRSIPTRDAHARIAGVQSRKHEMEKPIGVARWPRQESSLL